MPENQCQMVDVPAQSGYEKSEAQVATNEPTPLTDNPHVGGAGMAVTSLYTDSESVINPQDHGKLSGPLTNDELRQGNWQHLRDVAQRLVDAAADKRGSE